jgi:hypothetical protein
MVVSAQDLGLYHLGMVQVSYPPKKIETMAIQATPENIGALSLELDVELLYDEMGNPYIAFKAERGTDEKPEEPMPVQVRVSYWIVVLWDELHIYRDVEFKNTFRINFANPQHELSVDRSSVPELEKRADEVLREELEYREADVRQNFFTPPGGAGNDTLPAERL